MDLRIHLLLDTNNYIDPWINSWLVNDLCLKSMEGQWRNSCVNQFSFLLVFFLKWLCWMGPYIVSLWVLTTISWCTNIWSIFLNGFLKVFNLHGYTLHIKTRPTLPTNTKTLVWQIHNKHWDSKARLVPSTTMRKLTMVGQHKGQRNNLLYPIHY
jgi:hypothetical protein